MHIHILGICGTFMGGLALLARELGHEVSGCDADVYPPMSTLLAEHNIQVLDGFAPEHLDIGPDLVVVGNALSRGNPIVEAMLDRGMAYTSGPAWLAGHVLAGRPVLAVSGTHGKTTTASILAWILEFAGLEPGFLIGGVPENFGLSARAGERAAPFIIEADEYDTAFFDKRPKFIHYHPTTLVINNIEFDHADIFNDLAAIELQFHYLVRTVPATGCIIAPAANATLQRVIDKGCWSRLESIGRESADWQLAGRSDDFSQFEVTTPQAHTVAVTWPLIGEHNAMNAVAAMAASATVGISPATAAAALSQFQSIRRRLQHLGEPNGIHVYDDFAHHPTAIRVTIEALRSRVGSSRIIAIVEPRSNTMRLGIHKDTLAPALSGADIALIFDPGDIGWSLQHVVEALDGKGELIGDIDMIVERVKTIAQAGDQVLVMSNGSFGGIQQKLLHTLGA